MPLIKITDENIAKSKPPSEGWHLGKIEKFSENDSNDKKSKNWVFEIVIEEEGDNNGRYMYARFNSKAPGMLVSSGFLAAALDVPEINAAMEFNPEELIGKQLYGEVKVSTYEGKLQHRTESFSPPSKQPF